MRNQIAVFISAMALVISIISATLSYQLQKHDSRRSSREQLNNTIAELIRLNAENNALWLIPNEKRDQGYYYKAGTISQTASSHARQALYLAEQLRDSVTDVEYMAIAQALVLAGDNPQADTYWKKAIDASPSDFYKIVNMRGYADFLFRQGQYEVAREYYHNALKIFDSGTDFNKYVNAYTYQMWKNSEAMNGFSERATQLYNSAKNLYKQISNPFVKSHALQQLEKTQSELFSFPISNLPGKDMKTLPSEK